VITRTEMVIPKKETLLGILLVKMKVYMADR